MELGAWRPAEANSWSMEPGEHQLVMGPGAWSLEASCWSLESVGQQLDASSCWSLASEASCWNLKLGSRWGLEHGGQLLESGSQLMELGA